MKLSEVKTALQELQEINFKLPNGSTVPDHFHVTEVGKVSRKFIDCGGTVRQEEVINFQLWNANDLDHRLKPAKLREIIAIAEKQLNLPNQEVEVEYQGDTIETYTLNFDGGNFLLETQQTDCLAKDKCGIPEEKQKVQLAEINENSCCDPQSGCC